MSHVACRMRDGVYSTYYRCSRVWSYKVSESLISKGLKVILFGIFRPIPTYCIVLLSPRPFARSGRRMDVEVGRSLHDTGLFSPLPGKIIIVDRAERREEERRETAWTCVRACVRNSSSLFFLFGFDRSPSRERERRPAQKKKLNFSHIKRHQSKAANVDRSSAIIRDDVRHQHHPPPRPGGDRRPQRPFPAAAGYLPRLRGEGRRHRSS